MSISNDVSELESLVESLRSENQILNHARLTNEFEIMQLRRLNEKLQNERDAALDAAAQMKTIMDQAGAAIVHGMKAFHESRKITQSSTEDDWETRLFPENSPIAADSSARP